MALPPPVENPLKALGSAAAFTLAVGTLEGACAAAPAARVKFAPAYAAANMLPSFVGQKISASTVAALLRMDAATALLAHTPNAALQMAVCRAVRTGVAAFTGVSVVLKMAQRAGCERDRQLELVRSGAALVNPSRFVDASGVQRVRLCDSSGFARAVTQGGALPVLVSGGQRRGACDQEGELVQRVQGGAAVAGRPFYRRVRVDEVSGLSHSICLSYRPSELTADSAAEMLTMIPPSSRRPHRSAVAHGCSSHAKYHRQRRRRQQQQKRHVHGGDCDARRLSRAAAAAAGAHGGSSGGGDAAEAIDVDVRALLLGGIEAWARATALPHGAANRSSSSAVAASDAAAVAATPADAPLQVEVDAVTAEQHGDASAAAAAAAPPSPPPSPALEEPPAAASSPEGAAAAPAGAATETDEQPNAWILIDGVGRGARIAWREVAGAATATASAAAHLAGRIGAAAAASAATRAAASAAAPTAAAPPARTFVYDTDCAASFAWVRERMGERGWTVVPPAAGMRGEGWQQGGRTGEGEGEGGGRKGSGCLPVLVQRSSDAATAAAALAHCAAAAAAGGARCCRCRHGVERGDGDGGCAERCCTAPARAVCAVVQSRGAARLLEQLLRRQSGCACCGDADCQAATAVVCTEDLADEIVAGIGEELARGTPAHLVQAGVDALLDRPFGERHVIAI
ncbi:hypothetical protein JKP88DRAFT_308912 [Tribonema minus]|uniref:Uncharacterized protein n=1 Tax=Tribonema minus TaxID=303371 RepID=A0A836CIR3_9STRA|nr:hypothetical protein JKP88DRAFT_308912 [Tribonema minus]